MSRLHSPSWQRPEWGSTQLEGTAQPHWVSVGPCMCRWPLGLSRGWERSHHRTALHKATKGSHPHPPRQMPQPAAQLGALLAALALCIPTFLLLCFLLLQQVQSSRDNLSISITSDCLRWSIYTRLANVEILEFKVTGVISAPSSSFLRGGRLGGTQEEQLHIRG